jgi:hypothetical protein
MENRFRIPGTIILGRVRILALAPMAGVPRSRRLIWALIDRAISASRHPSRFSASIDASIGNHDGLDLASFCERRLNK